ncbi:Uncharacterised protein [Yersinia aleksiciae]|uniref:Uncharacterized protein n=1 Tax=Yersinia aleksiciae TaxID=263819 RepID=A0A0T9TSH1_YERAE|nr:Uncharacterised protein [Yersinia aleksiciae]CNK99706.1 Uncharacterised protein [Yersinia aleksiciae]
MGSTATSEDRLYLSGLSTLPLRRNAFKYLYYPVDIITQCVLVSGLSPEFASPRRNDSGA